MSELHDLSPSEGSHRNRKRLGRGPGSGTGKTAGRGHKGAGARSGTTTKPGFEGGQMPLYRRIPKRGFTNINRVEYQVVNVRDLEGLEGDVTPASLRAAGLISSLRRPVKVLGDGELSAALSVTAHAFTKSAREKIEKAGGSATLVSGEALAAAADDAPAADAGDEPAEAPEAADEGGESEDEQA